MRVYVVRGDGRLTPTSAQDALRHMQEGSVEIADGYEEPFRAWCESHGYEVPSSGWDLQMDPEEYLDKYPDGPNAEKARELVGD